MAEESEKSLEDLSVAELRERASELEITGRSSMSKGELLVCHVSGTGEAARIVAVERHLP